MTGRWARDNGMRKLLRRARRRQGLLLRREAVAAGVTDEVLAGMLDRGVLERWYRGVYAVGGMPDRWERRVHAAHLAVGPDSLASGPTAAHLYGLADVPKPSQIELLVPRGRQPDVPVQVCDAAILDPRERNRPRGVPATVLPRTLARLAAFNSDPDWLDRLVADAWRRELTSPAAILTWLRLVGRTPGTGWTRRSSTPHPSPRSTVCCSSAAPGSRASR